jgi:glycosyltransferase involved in cell wall biosynthesis
VAPRHSPSPTSAQLLGTPPERFTTILFVTHTLKLGGAERSLRELVRNLDGVVCDLVVPRLSRQSDDEIREMYGPAVRRVDRTWLPFDLCYRGRPPVHRAIHRYLGALLWRLGRRRLDGRMANGHYDAIHLNSVVLHAMVRSELPFIVHMREIVDLHQERVARSLAAARGVIFIDQATRAPFTSLQTPHVVLNNPFAMRGSPVPAEAVGRLGADPRDVTVFAIVGMLIAAKGVDRVIRAFRRVSASDARLLIVGRGRDRGALERLARGDDRIVFWGEEHEIERIYAFTDYVIRGETTFAVGRTIYEGLYAGSEVILPAGPDDEVFDRERFGDRIHLYAPGDEDALRMVMQSLAARKIIRQPPLSNVDDYVRRFLSFVTEGTRLGASESLGEAQGDQPVDSPG